MLWHATRKSHDMQLSTAYVINENNQVSQRTGYQIIVMNFRSNTICYTAPSSLILLHLEWRYDRRLANG